MAAHAAREARARARARYAACGMAPGRGFLPADSPEGAPSLAEEEDPGARALGSSPHRRVWEGLVRELPALLHAGRVRRTLEAMPQLDAGPEALAEGDLPRALQLLGFLGNAYVFAAAEPAPGGAAGPGVAPRVPAALAVPWCRVAARLGVPPTLSHASVVLRNWRRLDRAGPVALGNLAAPCQMLGGMDEAHFYLATVEVEACGAPGLFAAVAAQEVAAAAEAGTVDAAAAAAAVAGLLAEVAASLAGMRAALARLPARCTPEVFWLRVRPFLAGWRGNPALPDGLVYEGVWPEPRRFYGGSAAQSSLVPAFDALLGIDHGGRRCCAGGYLAEMRAYMPREHRRFLAGLEGAAGLAPLRAFCARHPAAAARFDAAVRGLGEFRALHMRIAHRYVVRPAAISAASATDGRLAGTAGGKGTGGTGVLELLRPLLADTERAALAAPAEGRGKGGAKAKPVRAATALGQLLLLAVQAALLLLLAAAAARLWGPPATATEASSPRALSMEALTEANGTWWAGPAVHVRC